jgi:NAD-dependent DNA ligase
MKNNINLLVPSYLIHSYLYYVQHTSIIEDEDFDRLCKTLHDEYDNITHHHKHLIDKESLLAGTGYAVEYNQRIIGGANHVLKHNIKNIHW